MKDTELCDLIQIYSETRKGCLWCSDVVQWSFLPSWRTTIILNVFRPSSFLLLCFLALSFTLPALICSLRQNWCCLTSRLRPADTRHTQTCAAAAFGWHFFLQQIVTNSHDSRKTEEPLHHLVFWMCRCSKWQEFMLSVFHRVWGLLVY